MNRSEALRYAASLLRLTGEAGTTDSAIILEQMADEPPPCKCGAMLVGEVHNYCGGCGADIRRAK